jgi:hypothetical protein
MEWYVSLIAVDHPVLLWDADGWEPDWGQDPHDGLRYAAPSLRPWLWTWAAGGNVWDEVLAQLEKVLSTLTLAQQSPGSNGESYAVTHLGIGRTNGRPPLDHASRRRTAITRGP